MSLAATRGPAPAFNPPMVHVSSQAIAEIGYDPATTTLFVRFVEGGWYAYLGVPEGVHRAFLAAPSHGRFFQAVVKEVYEYRKVS